MENLEVKLDSVVSEAKVDIALPTFVQTQGLPQDDALAFVKDCADGKRKIAKAVRNKYEGTKGEASEITEYSTFEELSNKISQIPIEVPLGSAMEQNGGVLPFYDVYNEALKAMKEFAGYGFNGVCAFELDKWSYDTNHTITLSGADAYYTSDKGELITKDTDYRFKDIDQPNTNRFVVYFFDIEEGDKYQVPKSLHATSCLNLWCVKGTPLMSFSGDFTQLNSINVYDGELDVVDANDFTLYNINIKQANLPHIKNIKGNFVHLNSIRILSLPNLQHITFTSGTACISSTGIQSIFLPSLHTAEKLLLQTANLKEAYLPKLHNAKNGLIYNYQATIKKIVLGDGMKDGVAGDIKIQTSTLPSLTTLTVAEGFKAKLNLTGCNGLERDVLLGIINNLGQLDAGQTLNLIMGTTLLNKLQDAEAQDAIENAQKRGWSIS